jgi:hypothetical protein
MFDDSPTEKKHTDANSPSEATLKINRGGYVQQIQIAFLPEGLAYYSEPTVEVEKPKKRA